MDQSLSYYLDKYTAGSISSEELKVLSRMLKEPSNRAVLQQIMDDSWSAWQNHEMDFSDVTERVENALRERMAAEEAAASIQARPAHRVHFLKTAWARYAAAIIILFGIGAYLWNIQQKEKPLITDSKPVPVKNDILPGSDRAVLTLSNGQKVVLDSASATIQDGTLSIENYNGQLIYKNGDLVAVNTMTTPKGGQYQLTLADGTRVWLNAASSITYPTSFTGKTREVSITGEAYFEVTKNSSKPFKVKTRSDEITVIGTSFNVNAYRDENIVKTSLLEGVVKVGNTKLKPGEAYVNGAVIKTSVEQDVAWKNGVFSFVDADIKAVMRQLARWYDVEINYEGTIPQGNFSGEIGRNLTLSEVLTELGSYGFSYKIEGKTVSISQ